MIRSIIIFALIFNLVLTPPLTYGQNEAPTAQFGDQAKVLEEATPAEALKKITMDLKGVDILDVLKILSKRTGLNIVAGRNVQGTVTLYLQDVSIRNALKKILETAELAFIEEDGIMRVMTGREYENLFGKPFHDYREARTFVLKYAKAAETSELINQIKSNVGRVLVDQRTNSLILYDIPQVLDEVENVLLKMDIPTTSVVFTIRYAAVEELEPKLKSIVNPVTGSLEIDKRSNKIYVRDLPERVRQIQALIREFDVQPQQVLIAAKVIEVVLNDQNRFGIDWNAILERSPKQPYKLSAPLTITNPAAGPLANVTLATLTGDKKGTADEDDFNFVISALEGVGKTNTLSSPRITVLNNQEAKLAVATREPFISQTVVQGDSTATTADNVQFVDVGVTLTVKPTITADNHVMIKLKPAVSTAGTPVELQGVASGSNTTFVRSRIPVVTTQEVETTVIVKTGTTIIMGGLIQDRTDKSLRKIPLLGDIPVFGAPFRNKTEDFKKTELVVFLTPVILSPDKESDEPKRFVDSKGEMLEFDEVADAAYTDAYRRSDHPLKKKTKPYWQDDARTPKADPNPQTGSPAHPPAWHSLDTQWMGPAEKNPSAVPSKPMDRRLALAGRRVRASKKAAHAKVQEVKIEPPIGAKLRAHSKTVILRPKAEESKAEILRSAQDDGVLLGALTTRTKVRKAALASPLKTKLTNPTDFETAPHFVTIHPVIASEPAAEKSSEPREILSQAAMSQVQRLKARKRHALGQEKRDRALARSHKRPVGSLSREQQVQQGAEANSGSLIRGVTLLAASNPASPSPHADLELSQLSFASVIQKPLLFKVRPSFDKPKPLQDRPARTKIKSKPSRVTQTVLKADQSTPSRTAKGTLRARQGTSLRSATRPPLNQWRASTAAVAPGHARGPADRRAKRYAKSLKRIKEQASPVVLNRVRAAQGAARPETSPSPYSYSSFVPENQNVAIFQEIQNHVNTQDPIRVSWRLFFQSLKSDIVKTLSRNPTLTQLHGDVRLEFVITQSGHMKDLQVLDTRHIRGPGQKMLIAEVLAKRPAYTPLPKELGEAKKIHLTVRI